MARWEGPPALALLGPADTSVEVDIPWGSASHVEVLTLTDILVSDISWSWDETPEHMTRVLFPTLALGHPTYRIRVGA